MALLFAVSTDNVWLHIKNIIAENNLDDSTTEESSVVQIEGNRKVTRKMKIYNEGELDKNSACAENAHMGTLGALRYSNKLYNLDMIISVGYRIK